MRRTALLVLFVVVLIVGAAYALPAAPKTVIVGTVTMLHQAHLDSAPPQEAAQGPVIAAIYDAVNGKPSDQPSLYDLVQTFDMKQDAHNAAVLGILERIERTVGGGESA